jgi:hypothetical protein
MVDWRNLLRFSRRLCASLLCLLPMFVNNAAHLRSSETSLVLGRNLLEAR